MKVHKKFALSCLLVVFLVGFFVSVSWALDARAPTVTALNPGNASIVTTPDFKVSFTVTDADDNIKNTSYFIKLKGTELPATLEYKGHWVYDEWDGDYWVIDSYREATVSAYVTGAKDGLYNAELQVMDNSGNVLNQTWNFTVASKPVFTNFTPGKDVNTKDNKGFSVKVIDNDAVDVQSIKAELDGGPVNVNFDPGTGVVSYNSVIPDGTHKAKVTAADSAGNLAFTEWSFTVQTVGPDMAFSGSGQTYKTYQPTISVNLKSNVKISNTATKMQIDGQNVAATFSYLGHFIITYDGVEFVVDSYNEGTISFTSPSLSDGSHEVTVIAQDELGNQSTKSWNFNVAQPPVISGVEPANGAIVVAAKPVIKGIVSDPGGSVDPNSISLTIDTAQVTPELSTSNGSVTVTYSADSLASDSYHNVKLTAADSKGNSTTATWKFFACAVGQSTGFSRHTPPDLSDTASVAISVHLTDLNRAFNTTNISLTIDNGTPVKPTVTGKDTEYLISYTPQKLTDGKHSVVVEIPSLTAGASSLKTSWSFNVKIPPVITKPSPTYTVTSSTPILAAYAVDNSSIAKALFTIDGMPLEGTVDSRFNRVSVQALTLSQGPHTAALTVQDPSGNETSAQWEFMVDTNTGAVYPDMPVAINNTCWQCHQKEYNFGHATPQQCIGCHTTNLTTVKEFRDCTGCHNGSTYITNRHASDSTWVWDNLPNRRHPVNDNHLSTSVQCTECHSRILTQEHNRPDRKDKNGNPITCDTCHTNTYLATVTSEEAAKVKTAVASRDTNCNSCHEQAGHASIHNSGLDGKCASSGCHNGNLQTEHGNNVTTSGKGYTCNTCHASSRSEVSRAIRNNQLSCSSCHSNAHGVPLGETLPSDIPLYQGYSFTKPIPASIFAGDLGLPAGFSTNYATGVVILSNRIPVNASDVWNFYKSELSTKGWSLKSSEPSSITTRFAAEFEKNGRLLAIRCYNTAFGDGSGSQYSGYRLEIWYK